MLNQSATTWHAWYGTERTYYRLYSISQLFQLALHIYIWHSVECSALTHVKTEHKTVLICWCQTTDDSIRSITDSSQPSPVAFFDVWPHNYYVDCGSHILWHSNDRLPTNLVLFDVSQLNEGNKHINNSVSTFKKFWYPELFRFLVKSKNRDTITVHNSNANSDKKAA